MGWLTSAVQVPPPVPRNRQDSFANFLTGPLLVVSRQPNTYNDAGRRTVPECRFCEAVFRVSAESGIVRSVSDESPIDRADRTNRTGTAYYRLVRPSAEVLARETWATNG
jgi:hypothetical protein